MDFIPQDILDYSVAHTQEEPDLLKQLRKETYQKVLHPRMLSGALQGRFLSWISTLVNPKVILEIGTYTGYGTICLAEGLDNGGTLHTIDLNEELISIQQKYLKQIPQYSQITCHLGNAKGIISSLDEKLDLVFMDADKENYTAYLELITPKMNTGGVLIADNVLWSGKVLEKADESDKDTIGLQQFNKILKESKHFNPILLPIRDGLTLARFVG